MTSSVEHQIARLKQHREQSRAQSLAILATQPDEATRLALADDVLRNDSTLEALEKQVYLLHQRYLDMSSEIW